MRGRLGSAVGGPTRRRPARDMLRRSIPVVAVVLVIVVAVALVLADRWRRGAFVFGVATLIAAACRLCLGSERVGILAVRSRAFDTFSLAAVGSAVVWLAVSIDPLGTD
ncbi:putative neutral ceramidase superfamily lipid hydrolase [Rhodococcus sp. PvP016]|uniref:Neutral ceramidase superfamily lipid hydrolase n=2 Tax=Mycobacteriales TaxID=85007 RepID=A0ABS2KQM1_9NOCA|nr:putative neutral ceramidase superfamily lipid hydrolase [Rhodococcus corynebacterioides]MBP1116616.1 putative neutral ceramidase superfamily lipid hydrolase [Rhodococcus sp. PvP016]